MSLSDANRINPDCQQGKHRACTGGAWDDLTDAPIPCRCPCHREEGRP